MPLSELGWTEEDVAKVKGSGLRGFRDKKSRQVYLLGNDGALIHRKSTALAAAIAKLTGSAIATKKIEAIVAQGVRLEAALRENKEARLAAEEENMELEQGKSLEKSHARKVAILEEEAAKKKAAEEKAAEEKAAAAAREKMAAEQEAADAAAAEKKKAEKKAAEKGAADQAAADAAKKAAAEKVAARHSSTSTPSPTLPLSSHPPYSPRSCRP
jgi:hypothetical protein